MLITIKELEDYLNLGNFEHGGYMEFHGGLHTLNLYKDGIYQGWVNINDCYYSISIEAYEPSSEDTGKHKSKVEELNIHRRGSITNDLPKYAKKRKHSWYYKTDLIFKGQIETLDDLKKLFKQLGIDD